MRFWPLSKVLVEKYEFSDIDATAMSDFLVPILDFVPEKRPTAAQLLQHPWFDAGPLRRQPKVLLDSAENLVEGALLLDSAENLVEGAPPENHTKENDDERDAMATELGNIAINGASSSKAMKDPQASSKQSKANATPSKK